MNSLHLLLCLTLIQTIEAFEPLLQAAGEAQKDRVATPLHFASPNWTIYHRSRTLHTTLTTLTHTCPHATLLRIHPPSIPGQPGRHVPVTSADQPETPTAQTLDYVRLAWSGRGKDVSGRSWWRRRRKKTGVLFVFGEQGRDFVSAEIGTRMVEMLCRDGGWEDAGLDATREDVEIIVVPVANPSGRNIAEMGGRCSRRNGNDVDLDTNWPRGDGEMEENGAFSEAETRGLLGLVARYRPTGYVSMRTGAMGLTIPLDCGGVVREEDRRRMLGVTEGVRKRHCLGCGMGSFGEVVGGKRCGTAGDFLFGKGVPFVTSWFVFRGEAKDGDCFRRFNPTEGVGFEKVVRNWARAGLWFVKEVHRWRVEGLVGGEEGGNGSEEVFEVGREREVQKGKTGEVLTGWFGVWTALVLLVGGMFVVRKCVFQPRPRSRRSRFLPSRPVKKA